MKLRWRYYIFVWLWGKLNIKERVNFILRDETKNQKTTETATA